MLFPLFGTGVIVRRTDVIDAPRIEQIQRGRIKTRFFRKTTWALRSGYIFGILGLIYLLRVPLLIGVAESWIVRENIEKADAIMLLGGGIQTRTFEAARLYHQGYAPRVMVADVKLEPTDGLGVTVPQVELMKQVLLKNGVPPEAITIVGNQVSSTHEEALALRDWVHHSHRALSYAPRQLVFPEDVERNRSRDSCSSTGSTEIHFGQLVAARRRSRGLPEGSHQICLLFL